MTLLTVRLVLVAACGGFAAYVDARTHEIPDLTWMLGLLGAVVLAVLGGTPAWISGLGGAVTVALAFAPGLLVRQGGLPVFPLGDYLLAVALGALTGTAAVPLALALIAVIGLLYGVGLLAVGRTMGHSITDSIKMRPAFAPVLALAFVAAGMWPLVR